MNKILATVLMCVVGAIAVFVLVLGIAPKNFSIAVNNSPDYITVFANKSYSMSSAKVLDSKVDAQKENYEKAYEAFNKSFKTSCLDALFQGVLTNGSSYEYTTARLSQVVNENDLVIVFVYLDEQNLMKDGKNYYDSTRARDIKFKKMWIAINNVNGFSEIKLYTQTLTDIDASESTSATTLIKTFAVQDSLYKTLTEIRDGV